jgi:tRNA A-37 threonylcarbamoyl transferase component Bud32
MALSAEDIIDGKYRIIRLLGEGGMGAVYEGHNTRIERRVAIKVLHGNVAQNLDAVRRFEREAQAAGRIGSKHIVEVLDLGDLPGGDRYMVMEFLDGQDLTKRIRSQTKLKPEQVYPLAIQLLEGLGAAHEAGIIHRDLKPDNIYLLPQGADGDFVKILDFGISKFSTTGGELSMTQTGAVMGTPYYMSPEQAKGVRELDQRTDLYSAAVILYEALSGRVPHTAQTFNELILKIVLEDPNPLDPPQSEAESAFHELVKKGMARKPDDRFQTAREFTEALDAWAKQFGIQPLSSLMRTTRSGSQTQTRGTDQAWAKTAIGAEDAIPAGVPKQGSAGRFIAIAAAVVVLAGGIAVWRMTAQGDEEEQQAARALAEKERQVEAERDAEAQKERDEADKARQIAAAELQEAAALLKEATAKQAAAEQAAKAAAEEPAAPAAPAKKATPKQTAKSTEAPKSGSGTAPAGSKQGGTTSTGRTIRTTF